MKLVLPNSTNGRTVDRSLLTAVVRHWEWAKANDRRSRAQWQKCALPKALTTPMSAKCCRWLSCHRQ
jgi:hypothetical protein